MNRIPFLSEGSKVAIVAPARKVTPNQMQFALNWLKEKGFNAVYDDSLYSFDHIFAGDDDFRAAAVQRYLDDNDIDAIWFARAGYGCIRIIDKLDFSRFLERPKWIVGFSDATIFHGKLNRLDCPSLHASMPFFLENKTTEALQSLYDALTGKDRMMHALQRAGKLAHLKGLVIGGLTQIHDNSDPFGKSVEEVIVEAVEDYDYPVCFGFPAGHFSDNRAFILGLKSRIEVGADRTVFFSDTIH